MFLITFKFFFFNVLVSWEYSAFRTILPIYNKIKMNEYKNIFHCSVTNVTELSFQIMKPRFQFSCK